MASRCSAGRKMPFDLMTDINKELNLKNRTNILEFWILDSLLRVLEELDLYIQAFADDVVLMFSGQSDSLVEKDINRALAHFTCTAGE
ncbi:hypothetical protein EVAR_49199_1 [Eumeta japonica]|uniref:Reverse transcriptase domain-containing protein n=1 Tax=Eumeta variegata TaxID=151549 RepID=A0A4C1XLW4_EUMVA|nr:hypothetical protein EVAR_49199_1 [Eumeta japonica]